MVSSEIVGFRQIMIIRRIIIATFARKLCYEDS
jgi:hypothetical protein